MNFCLKNKDAKIKEVLILAIYRKGNFFVDILSFNGVYLPIGKFFIQKVFFIVKIYR